MVLMLTAATALTAGMAMTSFAAWQQEDGQWIYTDSSGNRVTDAWRQSGNNYYYLGSDGIMVTDQWVEDSYYVNEDGARVSNQWIYVEEGTDDAPNSDGGWFFLRADGEYRYEYDNGTIYYIDEDRERIGEVTEGERLPEIEFREIYSL